MSVDTADMEITYKYSSGVAKHKLYSVLLGFLVFILFAKLFLNTEYNSTSDKNWISMERELQLDFKDVSKVLWPQSHSNCNKYKVHFGVNIERTFLVSFPRSGNTWTRYLTEAATGVFTSSAYASPYAYKIGFIGEKEPSTSKRTVLSKTHGNYASEKNLADRWQEIPANEPAILLIRNPLDCLRSLWEFIEGRKEGNPWQHKATNKSFNAAFHAFVRNRLERWFEVNMDRLVLSQNLLVICYENLIESPMTYVRKILSFLKVKPDEKRLSCLQENLQGPAKRNHTEIDPFTLREKKEVAYYTSLIVSLLKERDIKIPPLYHQIISRYLHN